MGIPGVSTPLQTLKGRFDENFGVNVDALFVLFSLYSAAWFRPATLGAGVEHAPADRNSLPGFAR